jgi:hypothetical protein
MLDWIKNLDLRINLVLSVPLFHHQPITVQWMQAITPLWSGFEIHQMKLNQTKRFFYGWHFQSAEYARIYIRSLRDSGSHIFSFSHSKQASRIHWWYLISSPWSSVTHWCAIVNLGDDTSEREVDKTKLSYTLSNIIPRHIKTRDWLGVDKDATGIDLCLKSSFAITWIQYHLAVRVCHDN